MTSPLSDAAVREYHASGFYLAKGFFDTEEIDLLGPVRVRDVEAAQQRIMDEVRRLEESGDIVVRREGSLDEFI